VVKSTSRLFDPREKALIPILREAWWAPRLGWTDMKKRISLTSTGIRNPDRQVRRELLYRQRSSDSPSSINAEYPNRRYEEDQVVNIVKSHESHQPNRNSTIKATEKVYKN
jgi:hypothetical protein